MATQLADQLQQVQKDLARNVAEVAEIGESLIDLGLRLKREPWKWSIDWIEGFSSEAELVRPIEPELVDALNRPRLSWVLEEIRVLMRRQAELKKLAAD